MEAVFHGQFYITLSHFISVYCWHLIFLCVPAFWYWAASRITSSLFCASDLSFHGNTCLFPD